MNNSQATTQKSDEVRTITTTETLSATSTQTPLDIQTTLVPSTFELEEQEDELLLPVQIETQDTAQLTEKAQALFEKLDARYAMPVEKPIEQPSGIKARRERNARIAKGKEISPTGDEYTVAVKEAIDRRRLVTDMSMPDVDLEQYRARARAAHIDFRQLLTLSKKVKLNDKGEADPQELRKVKQKNRVFIDDFSSGEQERQRPHLDRITDEILEFKFSANMFEPARMMENFSEMLNMARYLTSLSDLRGQFPWYFESLPPLKKELLQNISGLSAIFSSHLLNATLMHGYDFEHGVPYGNIEELKPICEFSGGMYVDKFRTYAEKREQALRREADRLAALPVEEEITVQNAQPIGAGAYKYGLPTAMQTMELLQKQSGISIEQMRELGDSRILQRLYNTSDAFHLMLEGISANSFDSASFTTLLAKHKAFIEEAASLSSRFAGSENQTWQAVAGTLGFMAMKAMSYSAVIANLEAEFKYSVTMGDKHRLKKQMDRDDLGAAYEGRHQREQFKDDVTDPDGVAIPVLSQRFRKLAGADIADDRDAAAIAMTIDAYEDFLASAQVPPCETQEDKDAYPERIKKLCGELLAFNDRITARALGYLDTNAQDSAKKKLCRAIEATVLERDSKENNFERVAELAYRLSHNDFSDPAFNAEYTGKTVTEALQKTRIATIDVKSRQHIKTGGAISEVYITKDPSLEQAVYRRGAEYRPWEAVVTPKRTFNVDIDQAKGAIRTFSTTGGRLIDAHKSSRDVAVSRVDKLLGGNVIADASHVRFTVDGKNETIGTKMEKGVGKEAGKIASKGFASGTVTSSTENTILNLGARQSLTKIYWLQTVDLICGSADRHTGNFFLKTDKQGAVQEITGIDNDMAFGEGITACKNLEEQKNMCAKNKNPFIMFSPVLDTAFPCIPQEIFDKVMSITPETLAEELRGSVRDSELEAAVSRLQALQRHFRLIPKFDMSKQSEVQDCAQKTQEKVDELIEQSRSDGNIMAVCSNYFSMLVAL